MSGAVVRSRHDSPARRKPPFPPNPAAGLLGATGDDTNTELNHDTQSMRSERSGSASVADESQDGTDHYEQERQRRIMENQELLSSLGISSSSNAIGSHDGPSASKKPRKGREKRQGGPSKPVFDRSGYVISLPPFGATHTIACVEMPSDRAIKRRIADGEYQDCSHWKEGEARRWRFGRGRGGVLGEGEEEYVGGVGADFRWRKWRGLEKELRIEMRKRGELIEQDSRPQPAAQVLPEGVSAYSLLPPESCHQCRRRSEKAKMKCRNLDPPCKAMFCETCCKRYNYFDFDPDSRSFICPLCRDCCNCANCIRKRNLAHLLGPGRTGVKASTIRGGEGMTVQEWLQEKAADQELKAPFDRVRLVDQALDIISPELPPEPKAHPATRGTKRKKIAGTGEANKKAKVKKGKSKQSPSAKANEGEPSEPRIKLVLKVNPANEPPIRREKEVDSDGDTVGGWSDEEQLQGTESDLTPISEDEPPLPRRFAFPSLPQPGAVLSPLAGFESQVSASTETSIEAASEGPLKSTWLQHDSTTLDMRNFTSLDTATTEISAPDTSTAILPDDTTPSTLSPQPLRRKPPPAAHIARAPRHANSASSSPERPARASPPSELPAPDDPARSTTFWVPTAPNQAAQIFAAQSFTQTYSYANDSLVPPVPLALDQTIFNIQTPSTLTSSLQADLWRPPYQAGPSRSFPRPPPYSHSPQSRPSALPDLASSASASAAVRDRFPTLTSPGHMSPVGKTSQNLDLLSMAASRARQSASPTSNHPFGSVGRPDHTSSTAHLLMTQARFRGTLLGTRDTDDFSS